MALGNKVTINADYFRPIKDNVFVCDLDSGPTVTSGGIIITDDNMTERGIRPRWGRVWAVGPDIDDIKVGEWLLIEHARWTNAIDFNLPNGKVRVWKVEYPKSVLLASDTDPRQQQLDHLPKLQRLQSTSSKATSVAPNIIRKREF